MASMSNEDTFKFLDLYKRENCLWNPKNKHHKNKRVVNEAWDRISAKMGFPVHELKKKKENLLATFRINLKKIRSSMVSGDDDDVFQPVWIFYDAMAEFLTDIYGPTGLMCAEKRNKFEWCEESSVSNIQTGDISPKHEEDDDVDALEDAVAPTSPIPKKRRVNTEMQEAVRKINTACIALNYAFTSKVETEEDEYDLFCKMLAQKIKRYPRTEREEIMYELHSVMINRSRRAQE